MRKGVKELTKGIVRILLSIASLTSSNFGNALHSKNKDKHNVISQSFE